MKKYQAIFFDWDGTAVLSRKAPVDEAVAAMRPLLESGIKLAIISGTTIENIAGGHISSYFTKRQLENLYLGLGRGAYNYAFKNGEPYVFADRMPSKDELEAIHRIAFDIHMELKLKYGLDTDVVFSRPNYCKIDLSVGNSRGDHLYMQAEEMEALRISLETHGVTGGLSGLINLASQIGLRYGITVKPTCDAKYLEVGLSDKSDNVNVIFEKLHQEENILAAQCAYWGDEFTGPEEGIYGSDSFLHTDLTKGGDFFDVSELPGKRPYWVNRIGGGVEQFLTFLKEQGAKK